MKTSEIARNYNIDKKEFESFLMAKGLRFSKGLLVGIVINEFDVSNYVALFKNYLAEESQRKAEEEARRKKEEEAKRKAEEEARRKAEEETRRKVEEEARRKAEEEAERCQRIHKVEEEFLRSEECERQKLQNLSENERRNYTMANCVKLYKEKLKGTWESCCSIVGYYYKECREVLFYPGFTYSGVDGSNGNYNIYLTGNECGQCYLCVNERDYMNVPHQTMGEITFSDDNNYCTIICPSGGSHVFRRV